MRPIPQKTGQLFHTNTAININIPASRGGREGKSPHSLSFKKNRVDGIPCALSPPLSLVTHPQKRPKHEVIILSSHGARLSRVIMLEQEKRRMILRRINNSATLFLNETITFMCYFPSWDNYSGILCIFQMLLFLSEGE